MIVSHFWHSFLGHSLMALCHLFGAWGLGNWVHDDVFAEPDPPPAPPITLTMRLEISGALTRPRRR